MKKIFSYKISSLLVVILCTSIIYFWEYLITLYPSWEIYCIISICILGYYFGIKNYLINNTPTAYAIWISFSVVACNEAADIILSPTSHPNEIFFSLFGIIAATLTTTILIDNLRKSNVSLKDLWSVSTEDDKAIIYILLARMIFLIIMEFTPFGDNRYLELFMVIITFSLDFQAYIALKNTMKEFPESESFLFWLLLWVGVSLFSFYQIYNVYTLENFFSIGLFVYLENILFFGAVAGMIFKNKFPKYKLSNISA